MTDLAIRIDAHKPSIEEDIKSIQTILNIDNPMIIAKEIANKTGKLHYHILINTTTKPNTIRGRIKKIIPIKDKYSVKLCKSLNKYTSYILKDNDIKYQTYYDTETYKEKLEQSQQITQQIQQLTKSKTISHTQKCIEHTIQTIEQMYTYNQNDILDIIMEYYHATNKPYLVNHIKSIYNVIYGKFYNYKNSTVYAELRQNLDIVNNIENKFNPKNKKNNILVNSNALPL